MGGTSFRRQRRRSSGSGGGSWIASILIFLFFIAFVLAWPYLLGTYIAVAILHAGMPSTLRSIIGWIPESIWLGFLVFQVANFIASRYFGVNLAEFLYSNRERFTFRRKSG